MMTVKELVERPMSDEIYLKRCRKCGVEADWLGQFHCGLSCVDVNYGKHEVRAAKVFIYRPIKRGKDFLEVKECEVIDE